MSRATAEASIKRKLSSALNARAEAVRAEWYGVLEESRVGRGRNMGPVNRRSAPGDAPARQTGRLMESIKILKRAKPNDLHAEIGPDPRAFPKHYYPASLEFGSHRVAPRPHGRPTVERVKRKVPGGL